MVAARGSDLRQRLSRSPSLRPIATKPTEGLCFRHFRTSRYGGKGVVGGAPCITLAGTPAATELSGTSQRTTAFAPTTTLSPIRIGPSSFAPAPMSTLLPMIGATFFLHAAQSDHDAVADTTIVAEPGIAANDDAAEMIDDEIASDFGLARHLDAGDDLDQFEQDLVEQRERPPQQSRPHAIAPPPKPIDQHHPEAPARPIAVMRLEIASDVLKTSLAAGFRFMNRYRIRYRVGRAASRVAPRIRITVTMRRQASRTPSKSCLRSKLLDAESMSATIDSATLARRPAIP